MSDPTLADLQARVARFMDERDWRQFHSPKNLAVSLAIEAAELLELFQWLTDEQSHERLADPTAREAIASELADVLIYLLALAETSGIDPADALLAKLAQNEQRFPADAVRGRLGTRPGGGHASREP